METQEFDIGKILDLLGNKTRRKILEKLSEEARYIFQLSEDINIRHQAIRKHLDLLKQLGVVVSFKGASTLGGPPRKYFKITKSFSIMADITPNSFSTKILSYKGHILELDEQYSKITGEIKKVIRSKDPLHTKISDLNTTLEKLNSEINELEKKRQYLVGLRQQILQYIKTIKNDAPFP